MFIAYPNIFVLFKNDLSGNTVWPQDSGFHKVAKIHHFWDFWLAFVHLKCKRSSLRSQCWMRLFLRFSNTMHQLEHNFYSNYWLFLTNWSTLFKVHLRVCFYVCVMQKLFSSPHFSHALAQWLKILEKVAFNIASYVYILSGQNSWKMPIMVNFGEFLKN